MLDVVVFFMLMRFFPPLLTVDVHLLLQPYRTRGGQRFFCL